MRQFGLTFHHHGVAVRSPEDALRYYRALGYRAGNSLFDPLQRVNVMMCCHEELPNVELVWPGEGASPIDKLLRTNGSMIYHTCYVTQDVTASLEAIRNAGIDLLPVSATMPAALFAGMPVSFHNVSNVGLIELIHARPGSLP
jgi:catechol 2,3-dioxygenase-like lactoylglutathione lyase family enzyme